MSRKFVSALVLFLGLVAGASMAFGSVPDPANSSVDWDAAFASMPFNGACLFPVMCPKGDIGGRVNLTIKDQFNVPMSGIGANEVEAAGSCFLLGGSPCSQVISVTASGPTDGLGKTTILISKVGGCCTDLQIRARGVTLRTLSFRSYDYTADGTVNLSDLGFLANTFNKSLGNIGYNQCFDFNCDNTVNLSDLGLFASHFNHACV